VCEREHGDGQAFGHVGVRGWGWVDAVRVGRWGCERVDACHRCAASWAPVPELMSQKKKGTTHLILVLASRRIAADASASLHGGG
jgi:hypothetical protein